MRTIRIYSEPSIAEDPMNDRYTDWLETLLFVATVVIVLLVLPA